MIGRRGWLGAMLAMTIPGLGGQTPQRPDQAYAGQQGAAVAPGSTGIVRARQVIVSGAGEGVFVYNGTPQLGGLVPSITFNSGTDPYGNNYLFGNASYGAGIAVSSAAGAVIFYTGSLSGGWSQQALIAVQGSQLQFTAASLFLNNSASQGIPFGTISNFPVSGSATLPVVISALNALWSALVNVGVI
jgi:hypothetical protein